MALNPRITDFSGQVVWLIGASTGIGRATAHALHLRGAKVIVSARNVAALRDFEAQHPGSLGLPADATDRSSLADAAQQVLTRHGRLDLVVYCAGYYKALRATAFDLATALQHQDVNYVGALNCLDVVLPVLMRQQHGHISLVGSVAGYRGLPHALGYGPTKAALINLAQTLYLDLHPLGLGVSIVNPGFVETPLTAQNEFPMPALMSPEEAAEQILKGWQAGRFEMHFPKRFTLWLKMLSHVGDAFYFKAIRRATGL